MPTSAPQDVPGAAVKVARVISSGSIPVGGFTPGTILGGRYRIIGLLGRGGMGEVYRADDMKLGQPVALKFLPRALADDPVRREHLLAEVRITRQLSHPNICRMYDIAEFEGQQLLSMEFIDGEDLASLIQRIGYLSNEKALDIAKQLVAGLAAAHERGVLHRDLKPANIMIDGRGRVRITDFGIAVAVGDDTQAAEISGTPAYMAPEQLAGKGATVRSDIYALGLILYELYCGKRAFTAATLAELRQQKESQTPTAPSDIRQGLDPIVERLILRCLDRDPRARPASVAQLTAALPGGDPLAAAIAAGETPSPEMVATSGTKEGLRPAVAVTLLAVTFLALPAAAALNAKTNLFLVTPPGKPPEALAVEAREFNEMAGYSESSDHAYGYTYDQDFVDSLQNPDGTLRADGLANFSAISFWYRQGRAPLVGDFAFIGRAGDPDSLQPGETRTLLDSEGRLKRFEAVPLEVTPTTEASAEPDWAKTFKEAGLDISTWTKVEPERTPPHYADQRAAWQGTLPFGNHIPVRLEAAAYRGQLVNFEITAPWTRQRRAGFSVPSAAIRVLALISLVSLVVAVSGALVLAHRNLRLGRGDRRGAARIAFTGLGLMTIRWLSLEHHVAGAEELILMLLFVASALTVAAFFWTLYVALEPLVRRRWPHILVTWTRLLIGEWRDPKVGRDVLVGCAAGASFVLLSRVATVAPAWFGHPAASVFPGVILPTGTREFLAVLSGRLLFVIYTGLASVLILFLMRKLLRKDWATAPAWVLWSALFVGPRTSYIWIDVVAGLLVGTLATFVFLRYGLVAVSALVLVDQFFIVFPITLQTSAWYFGMGLAALLIIGGVALYGFRVSLAGGRLLDLPSLENQ